MHSRLVNAWAVDYAKKQASAHDAQLILLGVIRAFARGPQRDRAARIGNVIEAAAALYDQYPKLARPLLRPILSSRKTDPMLVRAILLGLVRARANAAPVVAGLPEFTSADARSLALLLLAKGKAKLDAAQQRDLAVIVRGGSNLGPGLRLQAAWCYLRRTGQVAAALAKVREGG